MEIANGLEDKSTIPQVAAQMVLILDLQTEVWWQDITLPLLEDTRIRIRDLVRFIDPEDGLQNGYTNFEDDIGEGSTEYDLVKSDPKLRDGKQITFTS